MAIARAIIKEPGDSIGDGAKPIPVIQSPHSYSQVQYWSLRTSFQVGDFDKRDEPGRDLHWYPLAEAVAYGALGLVEIAQDEYSEKLLFDWGQKFHFVAQHWSLFLLFPQDGTFNAFQIREQFAAAAHPTVAGEGQRTVSLTEAQDNIPPGADLLFAIPWNAVSCTVHFAGADSGLGYAVVSVDGGGVVRPLAARQYNPVLVPPPLPLRGASEGFLGLRPNAVQVSNNSAETVSAVLKWEISAP